MDKALGCVDPPPPPAPDPGGTSDPATIPSALASGKGLGYNNTGLSDSSADQAKAYDELTATGAKWLRSTVGWKTQQTIGGDVLAHDRTRLDYFDARLSGRQMILLLGAPYWAQAPCTSVLDLDCSKSRSVDGQWDYHAPPGPSHINDYAAAIRTIATRYPNAIIETWNEPNLGWFWAPDAISPERMAQMQCAAFDAVKALNQTQLVAAPGIIVSYGSDLSNANVKARIMEWREYLRRMYAAMGGRVCWDVFSVHVYTFSTTLDQPGGGLSNFYRDLRAMRGEANDTSAVWISEIGAPTSGSNSVTEAQQRDIILKQLAKHLSQPEVKGAMVHTLHEAPINGGTTDRESHFGIFRLDDSPKPAACSLASLAGNVLAGC